MSEHASHWQEGKPDEDALVVIRLDDEAYPVVLGFVERGEWHLDCGGDILPGKVMGWMPLDVASDLLDGV